MGLGVGSAHPKNQRVMVFEPLQESDRGSNRTNPSA